MVDGRNNIGNKIILYRQNKYVENPEKYKEAVKQYRCTPEGKLTTERMWRKRRANKANVVEQYTIDEWNKMKNDSGGICSMCNKNVGINKITLDHIYPISKAEPGRIYTITDIQPICGGCNSRKNNKLEE